MWIPRHHWHHFVGRPVMVHTRTGIYRGHLHGLTSTHLHLHGQRLAACDPRDGTRTELLVHSPQEAAQLAYFPGAALAIPLAAVAGVTAIGLGALGGWW
ncbi:MAG: hypothetical protein OWU32_08850 [Firmicutes bacterium]|nr:hypothetical protein [Bacillota bacterium]